MLEARKVTKRFGGLVAISEVDFALEPGTIASIIGPNGAGKTTFFNVLTGIYTPDEGSVTFEGRSLVGLRSDQITALGVCRTFQDMRLFAEKAVGGAPGVLGPGGPGGEEEGVGEKPPDRGQAGQGIARAPAPGPKPPPLD